jgi:hypothetical protein
MIGYYSQSAMENGCSVAIYLDARGNEVEVTAIYENDNRMNDLYLPHWDDVVKVGELMQFVRRKS